MLLGEILASRFHVDPTEIEKALSFQARYGGRLGTVLVNMGVISEQVVVEALAEQLQIRVFDPGRDGPGFDREAVPENLNMAFLLAHQWLPLGRAEDGQWGFASPDPLSLEVTQYLRDLGLPHQVLLCSEGEWRDLQVRHRLAAEAGGLAGDGLGDVRENEIDRLKELAAEAPIVNLVNSLVARAVAQGASDLHFEPFRDMYRVRFRIDGLLHDVEFLPRRMQLPVASRIKILAGLDIAEKRRPQDGKISHKVAGKELDIRVSTLPLADGESLVLRFLVQESIRYDLEHLGLAQDLLALLEEDIRRTSGVILLTGPTGSGKTTTLYSCLNRINSEEKKIVTIEDPVEYQLEGINQIQVHPEIGYDFPVALRSILRQDPDVIMVGEIRDVETARIAMQSALTGHLVFSTVHTNDAASAYVRLIDLGVEEYLLNAALISAIAQRLVRRVCQSCAREVSPDDPRWRGYPWEEIARRGGVEAPRLLEAAGCPACDHTGYRGRVAVLEYLRATDEIRSMHKGPEFAMTVARYMSGENVRMLKEDGLLRALQGVTTLEEVLRVAG